MKKYIDKEALVKSIERRIKGLKGCHADTVAGYAGEIAGLERLLSLIDTLETREVDLDKSARNYLLNEHKSPLNDVFHQCDLRTEMQYHQDIENAYKAGFELGIKAQKGE